VTIAEGIYLLCAITSVIAATLLFRQHRARPTPLLFWSVVGFLGLALNNALVYVDLGLFPTTIDLVVPRTAAGTAGMVALLYGLIRDSGR
jgi:hypothetical protein